MKLLVSLLLVIFATLLLASCGDDDPVQPPPLPVQKGPFVVDFEDRPDDGFIGKPAPIVLASGVTLTSMSPVGAEFYDFNPSGGDNWGMNGCSAVATSDTMMVGFFGGSGTVSGTITFASAVSRVDVSAAAPQGSDAILTALDASDNVVGADTVSSACPVLGAADLLSVSAGSNRIVKITVEGGLAPVMDDLKFFRFQ